MRLTLSRINVIAVYNPPHLSDTTHTSPGISELKQEHKIFTHWLKDEKPKTRVALAFCALIQLSIHWLYSLSIAYGVARWKEPIAADTGRWRVTGLTYGDKQPHVLTFTPNGNLESPINLVCMSLHREPIDIHILTQRSSWPGVRTLYLQHCAAPNSSVSVIFKRTFWYLTYYCQGSDIGPVLTVASKL